MSIDNNNPKRLRNRVALGVIGAVGCMIAPAVASAQLVPTCVSSSPIAGGGQDVCQKISDLFQFMSPQVGVALSGGNTMLGESGTLGTPGKSSLVIRFTAVDGTVPKNTISLSPGATPVASDFGAQRAPIPIPTADLALSLTQGKTVGLTNVGGIDILVGLTYVPEVTKDRVAIKTDGRGFATSYGLRLGVLQESALVPGVGLSYRKRRLPKTSFGYTSNNDTLNVNQTVIESSAWRLVAGKHYKFVGIAGGIGRDDLTSRSRFDGVINEPAPINRVQVTAVVAAQKVKRNTAFVNLSVGLPKAQLIGEMGWSSKGTIAQTVNTFGGEQANGGFRYYSLGFGIRY